MNIEKIDVIINKLKEIKIKDIDFKNIHNSHEYIKLLIYIFIIIFIFLICYILFFSGILKDIKEENIKISNIKKEYTKDLYLISKIDTISNENSQIEYSLKVLLDNLPKEEEIPRIIEDLNYVIQKNGLKVDNLISNDKYTQFEGDKLFKEISYSLIIEGSYSQLLNFAYDISNMKRLFVLDNFNIDITNDNDLKLKVIVKTYKYDKEDKIAKI